MNWKRPRAGLYVSGPYTVERHDHAGGFWTASGPGVASVSYHSREEAGADCEKAARERVAHRNVVMQLCTPVIGDVVMVGDRRGQIGSTQKANGGALLYCIRFVRGKRLCLFRDEFEVVLP